MDEDRNSNTAADLESYSEHELLGAEKIKGLDPPYHLHVHVVRKRLLDIDNTSAKAVIDGLAKAGVFRNDSPKYIKTISYSQEKGEDEKTVITIQSEAES